MSERTLHPEVERLAEQYAGNVDTPNGMATRLSVWYFLDNPDAKCYGYMQTLVNLQRAFDAKERKEVVQATDRMAPGTIYLNVGGNRLNWRQARVIARTPEGVYAETNETIYFVGPYVDPSIPQPKKKKR
ncbi:MAG: hypothetical protein HY226_02525 [Candidatus Vogelbacteria bacterium]|nr:hypothetical protein [Candidatus Vogelbacteria bacterium]